MGDLKNQDTSISSTEPVKKARGNPNLKKGVKNPYYASGNNENTNMADENKTQEPEVKIVNNNEASTEKKIIPDDIFSDVIPEAEVLPLDGEVKVKDYATLTDTTAKTDGGGAGGNGNNGGGNNTGTTTPPPPPGDNTPPPNPDGSTPPPPPGTEPPVTPEQAKTEAEQFVKLLLRGYDKLHAVGRWAGKMDPHDLMMLEQKGKIDLDYQLPLGTGKIGLRKFFNDYNAQIEEDITVSEEFKNDITPPLTRIAIKKGWRLGDEGTFGLLLAEDLGTKIALLYGLKKTCNMVLESCMALVKGQQDAAKKKEEKNNPPKQEFKESGDEWREAPSADDIQDAQEVK